MKKHDYRSKGHTNSAKQALADYRSLLREGKELREKLKERLDPITKIGEREIRVRLT